MKYAYVALGLMASTASAQQVLDGSITKVGEENAKAAMMAVMNQLKDPMSAQFKSFTHADPMYQQYPQNIVCGLVNAKNGFGGYNGFRPFGYDIHTKSTIILADSVLSSASGELAKTAFKFLSCPSTLGLSM
ncbi:hypothetical protein [Rhizobium rhizoryzae]|uniref:hypothetical protein n=1 Tax=Rhizobium rhizoryzae TaxID=451876 RepID=UPI0028A641CF|nr:hypothetical protein [Rhizobium rhizoryzae]